MVDTVTLQRSSRGLIVPKKEVFARFPFADDISSAERISVKATWEVENAGDETGYAALEMKIVEVKGWTQRDATHFHYYIDDETGLAVMSWSWEAENAVSTSRDTLLRSVRGGSTGMIITEIIIAGPADRRSEVSDWWEDRDGNTFKVEMLLVETEADGTKIRDIAKSETSPAWKVDVPEEKELVVRGPVIKALSVPQLRVAVT